MNNKGTLAGCTIFITGASRGIGKSIAIKAAKDGANIVLAAKTAEPHPKLPGTIYTAAEEIVKAGGNALPCIVDVRDENQVANAVKSAVDTFGGIDIVINNASAVSLSGTLNTDMKKYDLMNQINARGTFLVSKACLPYLLKSKNPHILNICPAPNMHPFWFKNHVAYTISKYGMSMCTLGMAEEFKEQGVAVNALWPKTAIHTVAIEMLAGPDASKTSRKPDIVADAAYAIMCKDSKAITGQFFIDEDVLKKEGITDMTPYACDPTNVDNLMLDFFIDLDSTDLRIVSGGKSEPVQKSAGKIADIFSTINNNICTELVQRTNAVFEFIIKGKEEGTWFLDLKNGQGSVGKGEPSYPADAVLIMDSETFISILSGKLKPENAFMMGLLMVSGNLEKAMKVEELMISLISKL